MFVYVLIYVNTV